MSERRRVVIDDDETTYSSESAPDQHHSVAEPVEDHDDDDEIQRFVDSEGRPWVMVEDDETGALTQEPDLEHPMYDEERERAHQAMEERAGRDYDETIASALETEDVTLSGATYDDDLADDRDVDWALSRERRRALGLPGLREERSRLTDRAPGRPKLERGVAHDGDAIRAALTRAAGVHGMTFDALIAPLPAGRPSTGDRERRLVLARAVDGLRSEGASVEALAGVLGRSPGRVSELVRLASGTRNKPRSL